jgi:hypothetical protein
MRYSVIALLLFSLTALTAVQLHVPAQYSTIQSALDVAVGGDTVLVASGTYQECLSFPLYNGVSLIGAGSETTIIDAGQQSRAITLNSNYDQSVHYDGTRISGFTIRNGYLSGNGAGLFLNYANPILEDLVVVHNVAVGIVASGGGLYAYQSYQCP